MELFDIKEKSFKFGLMETLKIDFCCITEKKIERKKIVVRFQHKKKLILYEMFLMTFVGKKGFLNEI